MAGVTLEQLCHAYQKCVRQNTAVVNLNSSSKKKFSYIKKIPALHSLCKFESRWNRKVDITEGSRFFSSTGYRSGSFGGRISVLWSSPKRLSHAWSGAAGLALASGAAGCWICCVRRSSGGGGSGSAETFTRTQVCSRWMIGLRKCATQFAGDGAGSEMWHRFWPRMT